MSTRTSGNTTTSLWQAITDIPAYDAPVPSAHDGDIDVCVVGAGIAGLSVAYALARDGKRVIVLDDGPVGGGETGRTSAHLANALDDHYTYLERAFGEDGARIAAASHRAAIESIETIARTHDIACELRRVDGYLFAGRTSHIKLDDELAAAQRAGLAVEWVARAPLPFDTGRCLRIADQAEFQPLAYLRGLAAAIIAAGGTIHTGVHVLGVTGGDPPQVQLSGDRTVRARAVVDATNASITSRFDLPIRQAAYRSYVIGLALDNTEIPHALYWDTDEPYHYLRVARAADGRELLLVGGEDHRTGQGDPEASMRRLEDWARDHVPTAGAVEHRWSGQIMEPADALGYIGASRTEPNVYVVSGDSGNGLTNGALAGLILPALIRGQPHPWAALYAPTRNRLHGAGSLVREAIQSTAPYADWLAPRAIHRLVDVPAGEGRILRHGTHQIAVYRAPSGECHLRSASCPHLRAVVRWNSVERSWDCPAHGSRFAPCGQAINSPTTHDLQMLDPALERTVRNAVPARRTRARRILGAVGLLALGIVVATVAMHRVA